MEIPIIMHRQGLSVESCIITKWHKEKGDTVEIGDLLFTYETDKATFEEESQHSGVVLDIFLKKGTMSQYSQYMCHWRRGEDPPYIHPIQKRKLKNLCKTKQSPQKKKKSTFMGMNRKRLP